MIDPTDPIVAAVVARIIERSAVGQAKYGTTLERKDIGLVGWLRHMQEELLDAANYCEAAIRRAQEAEARTERMRHAIGLMLENLKGITAPGCETVANLMRNVMLEAVANTKGDDA
jgi:hypothetical protein